MFIWFNTIYIFQSNLAEVSTFSSRIFHHLLHFPTTHCELNVTRKTECYGNLVCCTPSAHDRANGCYIFACVLVLTMCSGLHPHYLNCFVRCVVTDFSINQHRSYVSVFPRPYVDVWANVCFLKVFLGNVATYWKLLLGHDDPFRILLWKT